MRTDGKDALINRLGCWNDTVAVAKAQAISAQIWSDYQQGTFDRSPMAYQPLVKGKQVGLLESIEGAGREQTSGSRHTRSQVA